MTDKEAKDMILEYMEEHNRPYNAQMVADNMKNEALTKNAVAKFLDALAKSKKLVAKEFGKAMIYWPVQSDEVIPASKLADMDKNIETVKMEANQLADEVKALASEVKLLSSLPSNEEADDRIAKAEQENEDLKERLASIAGGTTVVSPQERKKIEKEYDLSKQMWKKRKRMTKEISDVLEEKTGKKYKEIKEDLGLEDDEDFGVTVDNDETSKFRKK
eukprot:TRINITY_DN2140_c0_g1_i1.p1 TRINITY_DN2140_c0_g1~~TRINITY_DN2140_c0_g1_i1.p1  ORF type:complete len:253 (+),score=116.37 TRINITY_DN2140_c0_g1_i1:107-760(+)